LYGQNFQGGFSVVLILEDIANKAFIAKPYFKNSPERSVIRFIKTVCKQYILLQGVRLSPVWTRNAVFDGLEGRKIQIFCVLAQFLFGKKFVEMNAEIM
jgi:hypothetical protein